MASGYTRQSLATIQPGITVRAGPLNAEFDAVQVAFDNSSGHDHTGSTPGDGAKISLISAIVGVLPVLNGGTGVTTKTGTGSVVLSTSPTIVTPAITGPTTVTGALIVTTNGTIPTLVGPLTVSTGGVTVSTGGITVTGNSTITGTINATAGVKDNGERVISKSNLFGVLNADCGNPTNTASATLVMAGVNQTITPGTTGRLLVTFTGSMVNSTASDGVGIRIKFGTGTPPANGDAVTGTSAGGLITGVNSAGGADIFPFSVSAIVPGLTLGVAVWIDLAQQAITGGVAALTGVNLTITEI